MPAGGWDSIALRDSEHQLNEESACNPSIGSGKSNARIERRDVPRDSSNGTLYEGKFIALEEGEIKLPTSCKNAAMEIHPFPWLIMELRTEMRFVLVPEGIRRVPSLGMYREMKQELILQSPLYVGVSEVSTKEWQRVMGDDDGVQSHNEKEWAMTGISYHQALVFCSRIGGRLPTSEEFMYYCAGASDYNFSSLQLVTRATAMSMAVRGKVNCFGLANTQGGAWEWTRDSRECGIAKGGIVQHPARVGFSEKFYRAPFYSELPAGVNGTEGNIGLRVVLECQYVSRFLSK